jgi:hypothetical protein
MWWQVIQRLCWFQPGGVTGWGLGCIASLSGEGTCPTCSSTVMPVSHISTPVLSPDQLRQASAYDHRRRQCCDPWLSLAPTCLCEVCGAVGRVHGLGPEAESRVCSAGCGTGLQACSRRISVRECMRQAGLEPGAPQSGLKVMMGAGDTCECFVEMRTTGMGAEAFGLRSE